MIVRGQGRRPGRVPATEINVVHGLVVLERYDLEGGAYVAPYDCARRRFNLPDDSEPHAEKSHPDAVVLVRGLEFGPGMRDANDEPSFHDMQVTYRTRMSRDAALCSVSVEPSSRQPIVNRPIQGDARREACAANRWCGILGTVRLTVAQNRFRRHRGGQLCGDSSCIPRACCFPHRLAARDGGSESAEIHDLRRRTQRGASPDTALRNPPPTIQRSCYHTRISELQKHRP